MGDLGQQQLRHRLAPLVLDVETSADRGAPTPNGIADQRPRRPLSEDQGRVQAWQVVAFRPAKRCVRGSDTKEEGRHAPDNAPEKPRLQRLNPGYDVSGEPSQPTSRQHRSFA